MLLSDILSLVFKKIHYAFLVFVVSLLLLTNLNIFEEKYILKRYVVIGTHLGSANFPVVDNFVNLVQSAQFKSGLDLGEVSASFEGDVKEGLVATFQGNSKEKLIDASHKWMASINVIEKDLFEEESIATHQHSIERLRSIIKFYEDYEPIFTSDQPLNELALYHMLNDNREVTNWKNLNDAKFRLKAKLEEEFFVLTKFYFEDANSASRYFPSRVFFIGISLIFSILYYLIIIGLGYRKKS
tara:strand:- start:1829 stop:2554 length:726 start_codon:yes stop_codon:yes gene_type:complete